MKLKKGTKKVVSLIAGVLLFSSVASPVAAAKSNGGAELEEFPVKQIEEVETLYENFEFKQNENNLEYTYEEDGKKYKVLEVIAEDYQSVNSKIFVQNAEGSYDLKEEVSTEIEGENLTSVTHDVVQNKTTEQVEELTNMVEISDSPDSVNGQDEPQRVVIGDPGKGRDFKLHSTQNINMKFVKWTVGAIVIALGVKIPWAAGKIAAGVANMIYQAEAKNVYITIKMYRAWSGKLVKAEKRSMWVYSNKSKTKLLDYSVKYSTVN
jgi:peptidyl-tRNA hydrolase